jgi:hypothetical protein
MGCSREIKFLSTIVRIMVATTDWHIRRHRLRQPNEELIDESNSDLFGEARELGEFSSDRD